jgi:telomerase protein component 1
MSLCHQVIQYDAEFVLKVALYTRCELNIRTTANFLLAVSSNSPQCRPFLRKYYSASIRLPSDWIDVAELYQAFHDKSLNFGSLPTALRKAMIAKFPEFDAYQLAKYNKEKKKNPVKKDGKQRKPDSYAVKSVLDSQVSKESVSSHVTDDEDHHTEEELIHLSFTLKQLIRKLHIKEPVEHVLCLIGKKYPDDLESFYESKLPGTFDETRAGKRMKLPTPETWETQVSLKGNKASTWEELIDHNKLPFMAMMRNLRNLILAGISQKHHSWVIRKLTDEVSVIKSRQFPFRFFSAFEVLHELEKIADEKTEPIRQHKVLTAGQRIAAKRKTHVAAQAAKIVGSDIIGRYCQALETAVKIATRHNVKPIRGRTVIFFHVGDHGERPCTSFKGIGKPRTLLDVGLLLGLMFKYACEESDFRIFGKDCFDKNHCIRVSLKDTSILESMKALRDEIVEKKIGWGSMEVMTSVLMDMLRDRLQIDNLIILKTDEATSDFSKVFPDSSYLHKYRLLVNANLLYVNVNLDKARPLVAMNQVADSHENDIYISGYSDQILRFVAERGGGGQLLHVEQIDKAYNLNKIKVLSSFPQQSSPISETATTPRQSPAPKWRTVRVFISSTFKDMHGERDLLTRFVFPELRARAKLKFINVYEVDLRWGVTEKEMHSDKGIDICLSEVAKCDFFIGLLGDRYGWIPSSYLVSDTPDFDWLKTYPPGRSITELEIQQAVAAGRDKAEETAFFYFRDSTFLSTVPENIKPLFTDENPDVQKKTADIKEQIRKSGCEVFDNYPCYWGGVIDCKPMVTGLEQFGSRVLNNLWTAITRKYPDEVRQ